VNNLLGASAEEMALFDNFIQRHSVFLAAGFHEIVVSHNSKLGLEESMVTTVLSTQKKKPLLKAI
jgi:hypothetical protein